MTLPIERIFPPVPELENLEEATKYLQNLRVELQNSYQESTQNINGFFRNNSETDGSEWEPTIRGATNAGSPMYTYQSGWALRTGIMTEIWFNVGWSSLGGATGSLYLDLPYKVVAPTNSSPQGNVFFGPAASGGHTPGTATGLTYPVGRNYLVTVGLPGTYFAKFEAVGSGINSTPALVGTNAYVGGYLRYIGVEDE